MEGLGKSQMAQRQQNENNFQKTFGLRVGRQDHICGAVLQQTAGRRMRDCTPLKYTDRWAVRAQKGPRNSSEAYLKSRPIFLVGMIYMMRHRTNCARYQTLPYAMSHIETE
jgi:hypothetical protein